MTEGRDTGCYVAVFRLGRAARIQVGRLGRFRFEPGFYFYAGSAQRYLSARLARHARRRKPLRWHIDYLSARATMIGAVVAPGPKARECGLAAELGELFEPIAGEFGASDCGCGGHLFYARELP
jgi:sugar fermentation stimulation protein A